MTSIRKHLLAWLLAGLGTLWVVGGVATYLTVRVSLTGRFDAELRAIASEVRYLVPEGRLLEPSAPSTFSFDFFQTESGLYFEVWDAHLLFSDRSPNLGSRSLPKPDRFAEEPRMWDLTLETGESMRAIAQRFIFFLTADPRGAATSSQGEYVMNVVVARTRDGLDRSLGLLLAALGLVGLLIIPMSALIVRIAVGRGLQPLHSLAARVAAVDMDNLQGEFHSPAPPQELLPITQRLDELMSRLTAGIERERRLSADLAHELRTPVSELKAMAEVALTWPDKVRAEDYGEVLAVAKQMQSLIEGMLQLARWERGSEELARERVNLAELVDACWQSQAEAAAAKGTRLRSTIPPVAELETNRELFQVILGNLLSNAVAHSPAGSEVTVEAGGSSGQFVLSITNPVSDLEQADLSHLFEQFWRKEAARSAAGHAGLGLSLARSCAKVLGLDLSVALRESPKQVVFTILELSAV